MTDKDASGQRLDLLLRRMEQIIKSLPGQSSGDATASRWHSERATRPPPTDEDKRAILEQARWAREESQLLHRQYVESRERFLELINYYKY